MIDEKILKMYKASNKFGTYLEMDLEVLKEGEAKYIIEIKEKHLATPIAAHGGVVAAVIDGTLGVAALTVAGQNDNVVSTVELHVNYLKPVRLGDVLTSVGKVVSAGKRLLYVEAAVTNQDNVLVAKASGTFNAYPAEKAFKMLEENN
ncbi:PaaI family thioesterase [Brumimicrobium aurantiacum]|uniref:PaaI family thioesterase n=1 Tax=Brumimicrobium aurantiacum TaxID=1737063 RepID=A0A3E1EW42_9FLAO|nr:PaaI family thioesterase [Brumimicrobium aurantiacum]RFC53775.1 PaaI family thioesterase [Brumimicrobium aurantiacum]